MSTQQATTPAAASEHAAPVPPPSTVEIDITGQGDATPVTYEMLLAAICLAEAGHDPAQWAVEIAALGKGWDIGAAAFGSIYPCRIATFTPREVESVVAFARRLTTMQPAPSGGAA